MFQLATRAQRGQRSTINRHKIASVHVESIQSHIRVGEWEREREGVDSYNKNAIYFVLNVNWVEWILMVRESLTLASTARDTSGITTTKRPRKKSILNKFKQIEFNHDHEISYDTHTLATRVHALRRHIQTAFFFFSISYSIKMTTKRPMCVYVWVWVGVTINDTFVWNSINWWFDRYYLSRCFGRIWTLSSKASDFSKNSVWIIIISRSRRRFVTVRWRTQNNNLSQ